MPEQSEVGYVVGTPPEWNVGVLKFAIVAEGPGLELVGPCPRCAHELSKDVSPYVVAPAYGAGKREDARIRVQCNCRSPHDGRPDGQWGCGAEGTVDVTI